MIVKEGLNPAKQFGARLLVPPKCGCNLGIKDSMMRSRVMEIFSFEHYVTSRAHVESGGAYAEAFLKPGQAPPDGFDWKFTGYVNLPQGIRIGQVKAYLVHPSGSYDSAARGGTKVH
jgi:hypothetical protein